MKISKKGIDFIKRYEGFKANAYVCPAGVITIGWGSTKNIDGTPIKMGQTLTEEEAEKMLLKDISKFEKIVNKKVTATLTQNQYDMLVSHTYNTGGSDTLFKLVNEGKDVKDWWTKRYITGGGIVLKGLQKRRLEEYLIFIK
jgi:lysozyme